MLTAEQINEIELRAQRATSKPQIVIDKTYSCGTPKGYSRREPDGSSSHIQNGWHDVTYGYALRAGRKVLYGGVITVPHGGGLGTEPPIKPTPSADDVFFERARADVLSLIAELRKARG